MLHVNSLRSIYSNSNMITRLSGHFSIFGLVFFVLKSLLGIVRQWSLEKFAILTLKPRSHDRILIYRTWAIEDVLYYSAILTFAVGNASRPRRHISGKSNPMSI